MSAQLEIDEGMLNRARFAVKLSAVQGKVHNVPKDKRNAGQGFNFASTEAIFAMMRPILVESGLAVLMTTRSMEVLDANSAHVSLDVSLIDTDTGYSETMTFDGFGKDGGDKAVPKAYTMAAKYWARIAFMIDLQDDAEKDEKPARQAAPQRPAMAPSKPAASRVADTRPAEQPLDRAALAADYERLYGKASDLGLPLTSKDGKLLPATIPAAWGDDSASRIHTYVKEMVVDAEPQMAIAG